MSKFTRSVPFSTEFEGDNVSCQIKRLTRADITAISSLIDHSKADENGMPCAEDNQKMLNATIDLLPQYVGDSFRGLRDADGNPVTIEDVCSEAYFLALATEMATMLLNSSQLSEEDVKKSNAPPSTLSEAPAISVARSSLG